MSELAVHPVAALFPVLADDELDELVLDAEGRVLDGRNRLASCEIADVEPIFKTR